MSKRAYAVDDSRIISEVLDGETIIIDFKNGSYYSLNVSGSLVWQAILQGFNEPQIINHVATRLDSNQDTVETAVRTLLSQLSDLSLIVESNERPEVPDQPFAGEKLPYIAPAIQQFQDMQEMLLADPIHDVDESGWPSLKR